MNNERITIYKPKEFAKILGVTVTTLQRWDRSGALKARRNPANRRFYTETELAIALDKAEK